jgi:hypothetical protein
MRARTWRRRLLGGVVAYAALEAGLELAKADPDPVRLALLVASGVALLGLLHDALDGGAASWDVEVDVPSLRERGDPRLRQYLGLIDAHLAARSPDPALRDRLRRLATQVLAQRYAVGRDHPRATELVGPELAVLIDGPPRRLSPAEIDRCLTQIEEL